MIGYVSMLFEGLPSIKYLYIYFIYPLILYKLNVFFLQRRTKSFSLPTECFWNSELIAKFSSLNSGPILQRRVVLDPDPTKQ